MRVSVQTLPAAIFKPNVEMPCDEIRNAGKVDLLNREKITNKL
jgi:hypothetical protein